MIKQILVLFILFSTSVYAVPEDLESQANEGNPESQYLMGYSYERGQGNPIDPAKAVYWYEKAAANNSPAAQHRLGLMYATGTWVEQNFNKTATLFDAASKQKYPAAQADYAMFLIGLAPPEYKNPIEGYAWLTVIMTSHPGSSEDVINIMQQMDSFLSAADLIAAKELGAEYVIAYSPEKSE